METNRPHRIEKFVTHSERSKLYYNKIVLSDRAWLPLTESEAKMLEPLNENDRAAWFNKLSMEEKLRRWSEAERIFDEQA